ncbi:MAG: VOC family protein [Alphaproteobacteria bacterium]|nr:VOC family protein [Alphaproteobacteria bacterium]
MKLGYVILYVADVAQSMAFYEAAFGLQAAFVHESGTYGEMATGSTTLAFAAESLAASHGFAFRRQSADKKPAAFEIALVAEDVRAAYRKALDHGARSLAEPKEMPWGQWVSYVADLNGHTVEICSEIKT